MKLNVDKCKVLSLKRKDGNIFAYGFDDGSSNLALEHVDHIKDLGVIIDKDLSFDLHITEKVNKVFKCWEL